MSNQPQATRSDRRPARTPHRHSASIFSLRRRRSTMCMARRRRTSTSACWHLRPSLATRPRLTTVCPLLPTETRFRTVVLELLEIALQEREYFLPSLSPPNHGEPLPVEDASLRGHTQPA